jgi:hypothetical protein
MYFEVVRDKDPYEAIDHQLDARLLSDTRVFVGIYKPSILPSPAAQDNFDWPHIWDKGRTVIARYRHALDQRVIRNADGTKAIELIVTPWSNRHHPAWSSRSTTGLSNMRKNWLGSSRYINFSGASCEMRVSFRLRFPGNCRCYFNGA